MKGVTLVGRSTRLQDDKISGEEKYVIEGVSKLAGDTWLFVPSCNTAAMIPRAAGDHHGLATLP
jgi:hypothetical protein